MPAAAASLPPVAPGRRLSRPGASAFVPLWMPLIAAALGAMLSLFGSQLLQQQADADFRAEMQRGLERTAAEVEARARRVVYGLRGARGIFITHPRVGRETFNRYMRSRDLPQEFPGVRGFGFIERVPRQDLAAFLARERADGVPDFALRQLQDNTTDDHFVIRIIEPAGPNQGALGLDIGSEPNRRAGVLQALETGQATTSAPITLVQDEARRAGVLMYLPVFDGPAEGMPGALHQLRGFVYSPIVIDELLANLGDVRTEQLRVQIYDSDNGIAEGASLFDSASSAAQAAHVPALSAHTAIHLPGRLLTLKVSSTAEFEGRTKTQVPQLFLLGGLLTSLLLAALMRQQTTGLRRAQRLAQAMTADLRRLALVAQRTSNSVMITDTQHRINWVNEGFQRITGYESCEAIGRTPRELLSSPDADPATEQAMLRALGEGRGFTGELLRRAKGDRPYWSALDIQPLQDEDGQLQGFLAIELDITQRREMEARLRQKTELLDGVIEHLPCGLSVVDQDLNVVLSNGPLKRLLDLPASLLDQRPLRFEDVVRFNAQRGEYGPGDVQAIVEGMLERARLPAEKHRFERTRPNGTVIEVQAAPLPSGGFVTTYKDVTALREAQAQALRDHELLRGAIDSLDEAFVLYDPDDRLVFCNERYRRFYSGVAHLMKPGIRFEDLIRAGALQGDYTAAVGRVDDWVRERVALHQAANSTVVQPLSDGRTLRIVERRLPDGHIVGFRIDITEIVKAKEQAEHASRAKSLFLANMSHEIRTPMNAIQGMLSLLMKTELSARQTDYLHKTQAAARSLLRLLNDILDFSKVEAGKLVLNAEPFRFDQLFRELSVILSTTLGSKPVEVLFDLDPKLPQQILGDALRLQQVLINLASNAIKFTAQGEVVLSVQVLSCTPGSVNLKFAVRDTGIGIAPENQARIFSGFTQAEASTTRMYGGTGLGLAISQRLVALMGGVLGLQSEVGQGSTFHFSISLPIVQASLMALDPPQASTAERPSPTLRALLVDDSQTALKLAQDMAASLGWSADTAASGKEALALVDACKADAQGYDMVFMDSQVSDLDGEEMTRRIRSSSSSCGHTPLVVMLRTHASALPEEPAADSLASPDAYLTKPVTASMLMDAVLNARQGPARLQKPALAPEHVQHTPRLTGLRLLLVEDNLNNQQVASELLADEGAQVRIANNGLEAMEALASVTRQGLRFDAVLMDLQMPVMDGFTATARIRQDPQHASLPIVAMTANALASDREACLAAGMNAHVGKPFDLDQLVQVLLQYNPRQSDPGVQTAAVPSASGTRADTECTGRAAQAAQAAGVDLAGALRRLGGKRLVYLRMLKNFIRQLKTVPDTLNMQLAAHQGQDASRTLHTVRGLAAAVGMSSLSEAAGRAETALAGPSSASAGPQVAAALAAIDTAQIRLAALVEALQADAEDAKAAAPLPALEGEPLKAQLLSLSTLLENSDMQATELMDTLQPSRRISHQQHWLDLDEAVGALDFERASGLCRELLAELQP